LESFKSSMDVADSSDSTDVNHMLCCLKGMAATYQAMGDIDKAVGMYELTMEGWEEAGDTHAELEAARDLCDALEKGGEKHAERLKAMEEAYPVADAAAEDNT
jgi:hypothetical protein